MTPILPKSILGIQYIYWTSSIYIARSISISDVQYLYRTSDTQYLTSARARARTGVSEFRYRYRTSDIDIGRRIYLLDIQYIYWTSDIDFGNIGGILS